MSVTEDSTSVSDDERSFWHATHQQNYSGDDGRQRLRTIAINLRGRDGLHGRLDQLKCPVLWMHGSADRVYSGRNAEEEIRMFTNSADAQLKVIDGGQHFLSASNPEDVNTAVIDFVNGWK
jgi:pimeloyl-ACP methyl ester carboxylesterase